MADEKDKDPDEEAEPVASTAPPPVPSSLPDLVLLNKEIRDQKARVAKLKRKEKGLPARPGRPAVPGFYNPHLRAEVKLLSDLYKLKWMMEKVPDPQALKGESPAAVEARKEVTTELFAAEKALRKLMEENSSSNVNPA